MLDNTQPSLTPRTKYPFTCESNLDSKILLRLAQPKWVSDSSLKFTGQDQLQINMDFVLLSL